MRRAGDRRAYRTGVALAAATSILTIWTTLVRDDGNGLGFLLLVPAALVGAYAAQFRPAGMARTMAGIAVMHVLVGIAVATVPAVADRPGASRTILAVSCLFAGLWSIASVCFRVAARDTQS